jgi:hypothetical protein
MDNDDIELHELETIERNLSTEIVPERDATTGFMMVSPSGFMMVSPSGFMMVSPSGFMMVSPSGFMMA